MKHYRQLEWYIFTRKCHSKLTKVGKKNVALNHQSLELVICFACRPYRLFAFLVFVFHCYFRPQLTSSDLHVRCSIYASLYSQYILIFYFKLLFFIARFFIRRPMQAKSALFTTWISRWFGCIHVSRFLSFHCPLPTISKRTTPV